MLKVMKLHYFNMKTYNNGKYFKAIIFPIVLIMVMNYIMFYLTAYPMGLAFKQKLLFWHFTIHIMAITMALTSIYRSFYALYENEDEEVQDQGQYTVVLYNTLPVGKGNYLLGRVGFTFITTLVLWGLPLTWQSFLELDFTKQYTFLNLVFTLGATTLSAIFYNTKVKTIYPVILGIVTYIIMGLSIMGQHSRWWMYVLISFFIINLGVISWRYINIHNHELLNESKRALGAKYNGKLKIFRPALFTRSKFLYLIPGLTLLFSIFGGLKPYMLSFLFPYLVVIKIMSAGEGETVINTQLSLIKSLPIDKKKLTKKIITTTALSPLISVAIIIALILLQTFIYEGEKVTPIIFSLLAIKLPLVSSAIILILPRAFLKNYASKRPWKSDISLSYFLAIAGVALTALAHYYIEYFMVWGILSICLYALAIYIVKTTYNYMIHFLQGPLNIQKI